MAFAELAPVARGHHPEGERPVYQELLVAIEGPRLVGVDVQTDPCCGLTPSLMFHVKHAPSSGRIGPGSGGLQSAGLITTNRFGSSPRDPLSTPSIPATASCTIFRSRASMGSSSCSSPVSRASSAA